MAKDEPYELLSKGQATGIVELPVDWIQDDGLYFGPTGTMPSAELVFQTFEEEFDRAYQEGTMEPTLLLLDEPSTGMNREEKENLARFLLRIKHELATTMLWVEHDMLLIQTLKDAGVDYLFTNPGSAETGIFAALAESEEQRLVVGKHEGLVAAMP